MLREPTDFSEKCLFLGGKLHQNMLTFTLTQLNVWSSTPSTRLVISVPCPPLLPRLSSPPPHPRPAGLTNCYHSIGSSTGHSVSALCQSPLDSSNSCSVSALCQSLCKALRHRDEDVLWPLRAGTHVSHKGRGFSAVVPETLLGICIIFIRTLTLFAPFTLNFPCVYSGIFQKLHADAISQHIEMDMRIQLSLKPDFKWFVNL